MEKTKILYWILEQKNDIGEELVTGEISVWDNVTIVCTNVNFPFFIILLWFINCQH